MVINPDPAWEGDSQYWAKIIALEENYARPKGYDHICGYPTQNKTPCRNKPAMYGDKIVNGRCPKHGGYPDIHHTKKAIVTKQIDFMQCEMCSIHTEGKCDRYTKNSTCPIEAEIYERLWENITALYAIDDLPKQVMLDSLLRDFIRRDRAWRLENAIGTMYAEKTGITRYYERATSSVVVWFEQLGMIKKDAKPKSLGAMMKDLTKASK